MGTSLIGKALNFGFNEYGFESRVSKINYFCPINYLINNINFNSKNKKIFFKIRITNKMIYFLQLFKKYNLISSFYLYKIKKNKLNFIYAFIFSSYSKNLNITFYYKSFYLKNRRLRVSLKALSLLKHRTGDSIYLLSTPCGVINHNQALESNKSGFFLGLIHS